MRRPALSSPPLPRHAIKRFHLESNYSSELASQSTNGSLEQQVYHPHIANNLSGSFQNATSENPLDRK